MHPYKAPLEDKTSKCPSCEYGPKSDNDAAIMIIIFSIFAFIFSMWYNDITIYFVKAGQVIEQIP